MALSEFDYELTLPQKVQRLMRVIESWKVRPSEDIAERVLALTKSKRFDAKLCQHVFNKIIYAPHEERREACMKALLNSGATLPTPRFIASAIITSCRYHLVPLFLEAGFEAPPVSENDQHGVLFNLRREWTYPDIFAPGILMDPQWCDMVGRSLLVPYRMIDSSHLARLLALPKCEDARTILTERLIENALEKKSPDKQNLFLLSKFLTHENGGIGGALIHAGVLDQKALLDATGHSPLIIQALSDCEAWAMRQAAPQKTAPSMTMTARRI